MRQSKFDRICLIHKCLLDGCKGLQRLQELSVLTRGNLPATFLTVVYGFR
jgi:hypothetical protein